MSEAFPNCSMNTSTSSQCGAKPWPQLPRHGEKQNSVETTNLLSPDPDKPVLGIRNRSRIRMFLGLPDPDPLVRSMNPDPYFFSWSCYAD